MCISKRVFTINLENDMLVRVVFDGDAVKNVEVIPLKEPKSMRPIAFKISRGNYSTFYSSY